MSRGSGEERGGSPAPEGRDLPLPAGLIAPSVAREFCAEHRLAGRTVVFTNGVFDLLHAGHAVYLAEARALGDVLVVGLNSDASARRLKGSERPWNSAPARATVLLGLAAVDRVVLFEEDTPLELIRLLRPNVLCKGGDYAPEDVVGRAEVEADGGRLVLLPFVRGYSSTRLLKKIRGVGSKA